MTSKRKKKIGPDSI